MRHNGEALYSWSMDRALYPEWRPVRDSRETPLHETIWAPGFTPCERAASVAARHLNTYASNPRSLKMYAAAELRRPCRSTPRTGCSYPGH